MLKIQTKKSGAELTSIQHDGKEILFQGAQVLDSNGNIYWKRQAPILFPIVGQLKNSKTKIECKGGIDSIERLGDVSLDIIKIKLDKNTINDEIPVATYFMSSNGN